MKIKVIAAMLVSVAALASCERRTEPDGSKTASTDTSTATQPAEAAPESAPSARGAMEMTTVKAPAMKVLFTSQRTTHAKLRDVGQTIGACYQEAGRGGFKIAGPLHFIFRDMKPDPAAEFTLDIVLPVVGDHKVEPPFATKQLPAFKCDEVRYVGPMPTTPGWKFLERASQMAGHTPVGEVREVYLKWAAPGSPENETMLQQGIR